MAKNNLVGLHDPCHSGNRQITFISSCGTVRRFSRGVGISRIRFFLSFFLSFFLCYYACLHLFCFSISFLILFLSKIFQTYHFLFFSFFSLSFSILFFSYPSTSFFLSFFLSIGTFFFFCFYIFLFCHFGLSVFIHHHRMSFLLFPRWRNVSSASRTVNIIIIVVIIIIDVVVSNKGDNSSSSSRKIRPKRLCPESNMPSTHFALLSLALSPPTPHATVSHQNLTSLPNLHPYLS